MSEDKRHMITEMRPKIAVIGVGGGGGNAINNMIEENLEGVEFIAANTDAQVLATSKATRRIQLGNAVTEGLGAGSLPEIGRAAAEESIDEIMDHLSGCHMCFVTAGMGMNYLIVISRAVEEVDVVAGLHCRSCPHEAVVKIDDARASADSAISVRASATR